MALSQLSLALTVNSPVTLAASIRSVRTSSTCLASCSGSSKVTSKIGVFWLVLASDLSLRRLASTCPTAPTSSTSAPLAASRSQSLVGQGARCTLPVRYQDHTSSVANGMNGANRRTKVSTAIARVVRALRTASGRWLPSKSLARSLISSM